MEARAARARLLTTKDVATWLARLLGTGSDRRECGGVGMGK